MSVSGHDGINESVVVEECGASEAKVDGRSDGLE